MTSLRRLLPAPLLCFALGALGPAASAAPPEPATLHPLAVRGGVLAIPLRTPPAGEGLPARVSVIIDASSGPIERTGLVAWLGEPPPPMTRRWTRASNPFVLRTLPDEADPRTLLRADAPARLVRVEGPLLFVDLPPIEGEPRLLMGEFALEPIWLEPGPPPNVDPESTAPWRDDRPDPESPFEWFRWTLLGDALNEAVPGPPGDAVSQLMARHLAELWRSGLHRVERRSRGVADALRSRLIATAVEPRSGREVAAWIADAHELGLLLSILLDRSRDDEAIMSAALAWIDARTPLSLWVESDVEGRITIAVINPLEEELLLRGQWLGEIEPPIGALLPERSITRMRVERPKRGTLGASPGGDDPEPIVLVLGGGEFSTRIGFAPTVVAARPPSLSLGGFVPALSLAEVQSGRLTPSPPNRSTTGSLRLRDGRWELFLECRGPAEPGIDLVRCRIGGEEIVVRRDGGIDAGGTPVEGSVRDFDDHWRARIVLPDALLPLHGGSSVLRLSARREAGELRTTAVLPVPAFAEAMPVIEVDLGLWRDVAP